MDSLQRALILLLIVLVVVVGVLLGSIFAKKDRAPELYEYDHHILATQIADLRSDIHALKTQIAIERGR